MLTSTQNPLVKRLRQLGLSTKERRSQQLFLIEGTHAIHEAIETDYPLSIFCCTESWAMSHEVLCGRVRSVVDRIEIVSEEVLKSIATTVNPDGAIAVAPIECSNDPQISTLGLALESIQDPGNLGAIIRSTAAVGADGLLVSHDSVDLTHPKIIRATAGQWFRVPIQTSKDLAGEIGKLQQQGIRAVATLADAQTTYWDYDFTQPSLILLGNEGNGLSQQLIQLADAAVKIPLSPEVESLNVSIAAALLLYEAKRQRFNKINN